MQIVIEIDNEHYERIMRLEEGVTVYPTTLALYEAVKNGTPLEAQPTEVINKIPEDYVYDTETDEFEVYRHKYTGKEIHITKEPKLYKLESQPCEDCISREEIKNRIRQKFKDLPTRCEINEIINGSPSVTPQRPKGKWIGIEIDAGEFIYKCTKCGMRVINPYKYCPNCGAEMEGGLEDVDREERYS